MLFGQFLLLFLTLFGYDSLRLAIDWVSSIIPSVEALRHSTKVMNNDLARAHYALMWLFSPVLIIAMILFPVRESTGLESRSKDIFLVSVPLLIGIGAIYLPFYDGRRTLGLGRFAIGFALLSSFFTSFIALSIRLIKLILTDPREDL